MDMLCRRTRLLAAYLWAFKARDEEDGKLSEHAHKEDLIAIAYVKELEECA